MSVGRARYLRKNLTDAERLVWSRLRGQQMDGARFRRQAPVGRYVADFCCFERRLVIELDGGQHVAREPGDRERTRWLEGQGFAVLRYWNSDVFGNLEGVLADIHAACVSRRRPGAPERTD